MWAFRKSKLVYLQKKKLHRFAESSGCAQNSYDLGIKDGFWIQNPTMLKTAMI